jgi:hypothetical protein
VRSLLRRVPALSSASIPQKRGNSKGSAAQLLLSHYAVLPKIKRCFYSPSFLLGRDGVYYTVN